MLIRAILIFYFCVLAGFLGAGVLAIGYGIRRVALWIREVVR